MTEKLKQEIYNLQVLNYDNAKLEEFFANRTYYSIFKTMTSNSNKEFEERFLRFINIVLQKKSYFESFMFDQSADQKKLLGWLVEHEEEDFRGIIPNALANNIYTISDALSVCPEEEFKGYLDAIFALLADESTGVGLKTMKVLSRLAQLSSKNEYKLVRDDYFISKLKQGLDSEDGTSAMRHIDLLIDISNLSESVYTLYKEKGLMDKITKAYKTDDILLKLVLVEAIPKMGDSAWNAKHISNSMVSKLMIKECFDPETDLYVRKNLAVLIAKLIIRDLLPFDVKLKQSFVDMMKSMIVSWSNEEIEGGVELLSVFLLRQYGLDLMLAHKELTLGLFQNAVSTKETRKKKFFNAFNAIFDQDLEVKKSDLLRRCFVMLGDAQDLVNGKITLNELSSTYDKSFEYLFNLLFVPFADSELEALTTLRTLMKLEWFPAEFAKQSKSLTYLNENLAKSKEVFDIKNEIRELLIQKFAKTEDLHLMNYRNKLIEGIKTFSQEGSSTKANNNNMNYDTGVL